MIQFLFGYFIYIIPRIKILPVSGFSNPIMRRAIVDFQNPTLRSKVSPRNILKPIPVIAAEYFCFSKKFKRGNL